MTSNSKSSLMAVFTLIIVAVVGVTAYAFLTMPDQRSTGQKIGDAIDSLPQGVDKAARQLEDRTPGERLGDAIKDTGDKVKENTDR